MNKLQTANLQMKSTLLSSKIEVSLTCQEQFLDHSNNFQYSTNWLTRLTFSKTNSVPSFFSVVFIINMRSAAQPRAVCQK